MLLLLPYVASPNLADCDSKGVKTATRGMCFSLGSETGAPLELLLRCDPHLGASLGIDSPFEQN